jgi:hypothetical protein
MKPLRTDRLLKELANGFQDGYCLLNSTDWLRQHVIDLEESQELSTQIALILFGYLQAPRWLQHALMTLGAMRDADTSPEFVLEVMAAERARRQASRSEEIDAMPLDSPADESQA